MFGPRAAVEAVVLVAVPVIALMAGLGPWPIVAASAVAYLAVLVTEVILGRRASASEREPAPPEPGPVFPPGAHE